MSLRYDYFFLLSVQQTREHNYTRHVSTHVDRPVRLLFVQALRSHELSRGATSCRDTCTASCIKLQPSRHA